MAMSKIFAIVLIVAGALGVAYGGFNYPTETHETVVGPLSLSVQETEHVTVPLWLGIGAIVVGGALLLFGTKFPR
jgi:hypothetical protein